MELAKHQNNADRCCHAKSDLQTAVAQGASVDDCGIDDGYLAIRLMRRERANLHSKADDMFAQLDAIYLSHVDESDKQVLKQAYQQLECLQYHGVTSAEQDHQANLLFVQIDQIYCKAEASLTQQQKSMIDALDGKIDCLMDDFDLDMLDQLSDDSFLQLDPLEHELESLLTTNLCTEQQNDLAVLQQYVVAWFEDLDHSGHDDKKLREAFDNIDKLLNKSYDALADDVKKRVQTLARNIDDVYRLIDQQSAVLSGYYTV